MSIKRIFSGLLNLVLVLVALILFLACTVILLARWPLGILVGRKLVFYGKVLDDEYWETAVINYISPANWKWVPIESWPRIFGWRILPIGVVVVLAVCCLVGLIASLNWLLVRLATQGDYSAIIMLAAEMASAIVVYVIFKRHPSVDSQSGG